MQVKTQLLIEDITKIVLILIGVCVALYVTRLEDDDKDTDFPTKDQFQKCDESNKQCAMLGEMREC